MPHIRIPRIPCMSCTYIHTYIHTHHAYNAYMHATYTCIKYTHITHTMCVYIHATYTYIPHTHMPHTYIHAHIHTYMHACIVYECAPKPMPSPLTHRIWQEKQNGHYWTLFYAKNRQHSAPKPILLRIIRSAYVICFIASIPFCRCVREFQDYGNKLCGNMPCDTLNKRMHLFIEVLLNKFSIRKKNDAIKKADFSVECLSVKMLNYRTGVCDASCFNQDPIELNGVRIHVVADNNEPEPQKHPEACNT